MKGITSESGVLQGYGPEPALAHQAQAAKGPRISLVAPAVKNVVWALYLMYDSLFHGKPFRTLNVIEEANRRVAGIEVDQSLPAARVVWVLEQIGEVYGLPVLYAWITARSYGQQR